MADKIPVKARYAPGSPIDVIALQEFEPTDTIPLSIISGFAAGVTSELGNNSIGALGDVDIPSPADNEVLTFNSVSGNWESAVSPGSSFAVWGNITGTLSDQLDLQSALDLKADQISLDTHTGDVTIHFTEGSIDHTAIQNIGVNSHAQIDSHIADGTIHFTESSISHLNITDTGTNTHAQIDSHIADINIHYADAPADAQDYVRKDNTWVVATSATFGEYKGPFDASTGTFPTTQNQGDWFNVTVAGTVDGQVFIVGDILIALIDSPSTGTFAGNWTIVPNVSVTDHTMLTSIGVNTHAQIDSHIVDGTIHFTEASIDHTAIQNIGVNTHAQIDTHITDTSIHYLQSAISITESQISDLQPYLLNITNEPLGDLSNVIVPTPTNGDVLTYNGTSWVNSPAAGGGTVWGTITGTLSDQPDLQTALNLKVETASNLGGGVGIYAQKVGVGLQFKSLVAGDGIQITPSATELLIDGRREKFFAHNGPITQTFTTGLITVLFPTVVRSDPAYTYNAGLVTINTAGWYFIEYQFSATNTGNTRASSETGLTVNSLTVFQPGSLGYAYHRNAVSGKASFTGRILIQLAVNDVIRVRSHRDGAGSTLETLPDACRLTIISTGAP